MADARLDSMHFGFTPRRQSYRRARDALLGAQGWVTRLVEHVHEWEERGFRARPDFDDWGAPSQDIAPTRRPLDYVREGRILTGFELEEDLRYILDRLGTASLMYASDYPHGDMSWSKVADTRAHPDLTPTEVDALLGGNAARFYKLPVAAPA